MTNFKGGVFTFRKLRSPNLICEISSRGIGDLSRGNERNLDKFCRLLKIDINQVVRARQIHGSKISEVTSNGAGKVIDGTDGLVTKDENIYLLVVVADCLPIAFFDPIQKIVGVVHAGWKGTAKNISIAAVNKLIEKGSDPKDILVGIGPGICQKHYQVGKEVADLFGKRSVKSKGGKFYLDLHKVNVDQLIKAGIKEKNIDHINLCTFEDTRFYSWRREKPNLKGEFGLVAGITHG